MVLEHSYAKRTGKLSDISTILSVDELAKNHSDSLSEQWEQPFFPVSKMPKQREPSFCCIRLFKATIGCATAAAVMSIIFAIFLCYRIISSLIRNAVYSSHLKFSSVLIAISLLYAVFAVLLIIGVQRHRRKYMIPMIVMTVCLVAAAVGTVVAVTINVIENIREEVQERKSQIRIFLLRVVLFRIILITIIVANIVFTVSYIRCYRYLAKIAKLQTPLLGMPSVL